MTNNLPYRSFHSSILNYPAPAIRSPINKTLPSYLTFPSILGYPIAKYLSRISKHATRCTFSRWWIRSGNKHRVARASRLKPRRWNSWPEKFNPPPLFPRIPLAKSVQLNPFLFVKRLRFNSCRDTLFISNRVIHPTSPSSSYAHRQPLFHRTRQTTMEHTRVQQKRPVYVVPVKNYPPEQLNVFHPRGEDISRRFFPRSREFHSVYQTQTGLSRDAISLMRRFKRDSSRF